MKEKNGSMSTALKWIVTILLGILISIIGYEGVDVKQKVDKNCDRLTRFETEMDYIKSGIAETKQMNERLEKVLGRVERKLGKQRGED